MDYSQRSLALDRIRAAREYTQRLLDATPESDWFRGGESQTTHIAWQVGHLAMAEYGLVLFRVRGRMPIDTELMSSKFRKKFSRGTTPDFDEANNPPLAEIRGVFDAVHQQALKEIPEFTDEQLNKVVDRPYAVYPNNFGGLLFCADHEMLHAGQIGLLRRLLGHEPLG